MKRLYPFLLLLISFYGYAQNKPPVQKRHNTYFLKNDGSPVNSIDSADYIRLVIEPDSGTNLYGVEDYYKNNHPRFVGKSSRINPVNLEEQGLSFYPNGHKKLLIQYRHGQIYGAAYQFYPNGKIYIAKEYITDQKDLDRRAGTASRDSIITAVYDSTGKAIAENGNGYYIRYDNEFKTIEEEGPLKNSQPDGKWKGKDPKRETTFEEQYVNGSLISGTSTDSTGVKTTYQKRFVSPDFPGGLNAFGQYLGRNIRYPQDAREHNTEGTVLLIFVVKQDGSITNIKIINPVSKSIDEEAIRVMNGSPKWIPGMAYGKAAPYRYSVPISFALR